jgi:hypothetical protein
MWMKTRGFAAFVAPSLIVAGLWSAPAHAAASGSLTANSGGVLYDDCRDVAVGTYSVAVTPDVDHWNLDIDITAPDGTHEAGNFFSSFFDPASGTIEAFFCGSEMPGTYTISGSGVWSDYETNRYDVPYTVPAATFKMRQPKSKTTAKGKQGNRATYVINVTVKDERPNGYYPTDFATVKLQKRVRGNWVSVSGAKDYTDSKGRASFKVSTSGPPYKVRAVTPKSGRLAKSVSRPVAVP